MASAGSDSRPSVGTLSRAKRVGQGKGRGVGEGGGGHSCGMSWKLM